MSSVPFHNFIGEPPPRSAEIVERCTADAVQRTKRTGRTWAIAIATCLVGVMGFNDLYSSDGSTPSAGLLIGMLATLDALAALAIRFSIRRDLKPLRRLAREGLAHRPSDTSIHDGLTGDKTLRVFWREGDKDASADVELHRTQIEACSRDEVVILARPRDKYVVALLGSNGVFVGKRRVVLWGR